MQMRQRRACQCVESFAARHAAIALQAVGLAMPVESCRATSRAMQLRQCCLFDQGDGRSLRRAAAQQVAAGKTLAERQLRELPGEGLPLGCIHDRLLKRKYLFS